MIEVPPIMPFFYASIKKRTDYALILPYCAREDTHHLMAVRGSWFRDLTQCCRWLRRRAGALSGRIAKRASSCTPRFIKVATQAGVRLACTTGAYSTSTISCSRHFVNMCEPHAHAHWGKYILCAYYAGIMLHSFVALLCPNYSQYKYPQA